MTPNPATGIGLVLGAGGIVGEAFHAGVVGALADVAGWDAREADLLVGTSAGSLTAALLRAGLSASDLAAHLADEPLSLEGAHIITTAGRQAHGRRRPPLPRHRSWAPAAPERLVRAARRPWEIRVGTLAAAMLPAGRVRVDAIHDSFEPLFGAEWPARELWICAVRLADGARVVFGREGAPAASVADAVAASCAIPGWFVPVTINGQRFVDGGAYSTTNLDVVAGAPLGTVLVSAPMSLSGPQRTSFDSAARAAGRIRLRQEASRVRSHGTRVISLEPDAEDLRVMGTFADAMDPRRRAAVVHRVRASFAERLRSSGAAEMLQAAALRQVGREQHR